MNLMVKTCFVITHNSGMKYKHRIPNSLWFLSSKFTNVKTTVNLVQLIMVHIDENVIVHFFVKLPCIYFLLTYVNLSSKKI